MTDGAQRGEQPARDPGSETPGAIAKHTLFIVGMLLVVFLAAISGCEWWLGHKLAHADVDADKIVLRQTIRLTAAEPRQDWEIDWSDWNSRRGTAWTRVYCRRLPSPALQSVEPCVLRARIATDSCHEALLGELSAIEPEPVDWKLLTLAEPDQWVMLGNGRTHPDGCCPTALGFESIDGCFGEFEVAVELSDGAYDSDRAEVASVTSFLVGLAGIAKLGSLLALGAVLVLLRLVRHHGQRSAATPT